MAATPPFHVPDEVLHFWRSEAIAAGHFIPNGGGEPDSANIPQGLKTLVWVILEKHDYRMAYAIPLEPVKEPRVEFPAWYTPVPYAPQAIAAGICRLLNVRPLIGFYAGRLATLIAALALVLIALRIAPQLSPVVTAITLLPMTLFLFASWSADAMTIALAILLTAMLFAEDAPPAAATAAVALALALCKPAYFLIAAMVFVTSKSWGRIAWVIGATIAGTFTSFAYARMAYFHQRPGLPVDAAQQLRCILSDPLRFGRTGVHDLAIHAAPYLEQMIGRLGLTDVNLPRAVIAVEGLVLLAAGLGSGLAMTAGRRTAAIAIAIATVCGIVLSQYLTWSIICSDRIEGVQGRYFLPVLPLALAVISLPRARWRMEGVIIAVAAVCNVVALITLVRA